MEYLNPYPALHVAGPPLIPSHSPSHQHWGLVDVEEGAIQGVQVAIVRLVRASDGGLGGRAGWI